MRLPAQLDGILVLDKPRGPSSAKCVEAVKFELGQKKIGHAGTLDPMAQGVLVVLLGQATKLSGFLLAGDKVYRGRFELGRATDTYDDLGEVVARHDGPLPGREEVEAAVAAWNGVARQEVPPYSAAKHQGAPLYKLARAGKAAPVKVKDVKISQAAVLSRDAAWVDFRVRVSSGTYIRSLVHSLGTRTGVGAVLIELVREYSHPFGIDQAVGLGELLDDPAQLTRRVLPLTAALPGWPSLVVSGEAERAARQGIWLAAEGDFAPDPGHANAFFVTDDGAPLALAALREKDGKPMWAVARGLW
ncbi:MAG: tRNA pseudouridine(55) synthase TruB [Desulfovibrionaceae bacterium]|nr:tRNA pseudouridine(55) synthase TruB [Desulfovibrionaceae bacterium]